MHICEEHKNKSIKHNSNKLTETVHKRFKFQTLSLGKQKLDCS